MTALRNEIFNSRGPSIVESCVLWGWAIFIHQRVIDRILLLVAIGNAFAVLSCPEKRLRYDQYGTEEEQVPVMSDRYFYHNGGYEYDFTRGFEGKHSIQ